jgi:hypothetical protein
MANVNYSIKKSAALRQVYPGHYYDPFPSEFAFP